MVYPKNLRLYAINLLLNGASIKDISDQIGCDQTTVRRWKRSLENTKNISPKKSTGRPKKLDERSQRQLLRNVRKNPKQSAKVLGASLSTPVSGQTVRKYLNSNNIFSYKPLKKPIISKKNAKHRLQWAKEHAALTKEDLDLWVFSDEAPFNILCSEYSGRVWSTPNTRSERNKLKIRAHSGGGRVMIWGAISVHGPGPLVFLEGTVNGLKYANIAEKTIIPYLFELMGESGKPFVFVDDNAPAHNSRVASEIFEKYDARRIYWPASSPDLNPIENLWAWMKRKLWDSDQQYKSVEDMKAAITRIWAEITPEYCRELIYSVPKRCIEVIKAKGWQNRIY